MSDLPELQRRAFADSKAWFPHLHDDPRRALAHHLAGLAGEVGELVSAAFDCEQLDSHDPLNPTLLAVAMFGSYLNETKKANRDGDVAETRRRGAELLRICADLIPGGSSWRRSTPADEAPDVLIYLLDACEAMGVDLASALESKRAVLIERWGDPS